MARFVVRRLVTSAFLLVGVSMVVFALMHLAGGDPATILVGPTASPEDLARVRHEYGLDKPVPVQYLIWAGRVGRGDLGRSLTQRRDVRVIVLERFRATAILATASLVVATAIGISVGVIAATRQYSLLDKVATVGAVLGISVPPFWLGLMLVILFSVKLSLLPGTGMHPPGGGNIGDLLRHLILPAVTLAAVPTAVLARTTRSSLLEVLGQDYVRVARAKGLAESTVLRRHALRNALVSVVTIVGLQVGFLLSGAVLVETVFSWPGLGATMVDGILRRDYPLVQGGVLLVASVFLLVNLITDIVYVFLDPRLQTEAGAGA